MNVVFAKEVNILQYWTIVKGVSSFVANSTWSGCVKSTICADGINIGSYNVFKGIANFIWYIDDCRVVSIKILID